MFIFADVENDHRLYLLKLDGEIDRLLDRVNALVVRIDELKSNDVAVHSQVELLATMRVAIKSLRRARADALRVLETGECRAHSRSEEKSNNRNKE